MATSKTSGANEIPGPFSSDSNHREPRVSRGILLVMATVAIFAVNDVLSKYLTRFYPITLIVWARYTFHLLLIAVVLGPRVGLRLVRTARPVAQLVRALTLTAASLLIVSSFKYMPVAEASAIAFLAPIVVTVLSVIFLKERVQPSRWIAVLCAFLGVLIIIRPGSDIFTWAMLLPMGNAVAFASYQIMTRRLAGLESTYASIFYPGLIGTLVLSTTLPYCWVMPQSGLHALAFVVIGMLNGLSHLTLIKAYEHAPASRLAPFSYSQLIWVSLIGYVVFGDFPDTWSLLGIAILVTSGIYNVTHQRIAEWLQRRESA